MQGLRFVGFQNLTFDWFMHINKIKLFLDLKTDFHDGLQTASRITLVPKTVAKLLCNYNTAT